jgi:hypothetical protein
LGSRELAQRLETIEKSMGSAAYCSRSAPVRGVNLPDCCLSGYSIRYVYTIDLNAEWGFGSFDWISPNAEKTLGSDRI